jgi:hypothetical protein
MSKLSDHYQTAKARRDRLEARVHETSLVLQSFPKSSIGLTPDHIKFGADYRLALADFQAANTGLRMFNTWFLRHFASQVKADREIEQRARYERLRVCAYASQGEG